MNGLEGFITSFNSETNRYLIRIDLTGEIKSVKEENIYIPLPNGWMERIDDSTGKSYFIHNTSGETTWSHPILKRGKRKPTEDAARDEFVGQDEEDSDREDRKGDEETGFDRSEFLKQEEKRLRLF
jgi:hypothetical protein